MARPDDRTFPDVDAELARLRAEVTDLGAALDAVTVGGIDAVVIGPPGAERLFSISTAERPYRQIVDHMSEAAATVSAHGTILFVNRRMTELVECEARALVGSAVDRLVVPSDRAVLHRLLEVEGNARARASATMAGPAQVRVSLSSSCIDVEGTTVRCLIATDVTAELASFPSSATYRLRPPLQAIEGLCLILAEDHGPALGHEGRALVGQVQEWTARIAARIEAPLVRSTVRVEPMEREPVEVSRLAAAIFDELTGGEPNRAVAITVTSGLTTYGNAELLRSVLRHLLSNAWKFTRNVDRPTIEVGVQVVDGESRYFVRDNGVGFDMRDADRVFEPFERLHPESAFEGSGMGLAIVSRDIALLGGRVWVESARDAGTTFWFTTGASAPIQGRA